MDRLDILWGEKGIFRGEHQRELEQRARGEQESTEKAMGHLYISLGEELMSAIVQGSSRRTTTNDAIIVPKSCDALGD